jgi:hypothetical protein
MRQVLSKGYRFRNSDRRTIGAATPQKELSHSQSGHDPPSRRESLEIGREWIPPPGDVCCRC